MGCEIFTRFLLTEVYPYGRDRCQMIAGPSAVPLHHTGLANTCVSDNHNFEQIVIISIHVLSDDSDVFELKRYATKVD